MQSETVSDKDIPVVEFAQPDDSKLPQAIFDDQEGHSNVPEHMKIWN
jgi:hypothetical protein